MLAKSMMTLAAARSTVSSFESGALTAQFRAGLRTRSFATAKLNAPATPHRVVPVTTADGAQLRVHVYGDDSAPTLVLIHGWACSIEYWNPQISAFADDYRVVAYDQRGHGESTLGSVLPSENTLADDLATVLEATLRPGEQAVLAGHSMGGLTIQAWAKHHPRQVTERAAAVLLANTANSDIRAETDLLPLLNKQLTVATYPVTILGAPVRMPQPISETVLFTPVPIPGGWLTEQVFRYRILTPEATADEIDFAIGIIRSCRPLARARHAAAMADMDLTAGTANLTVPTTVIASAQDRLLPPRMSRPMVDVLRRSGHLADFELLPHGHLSNIEDTEAFDTTLRRILRTAMNSRFTRGKTATS
ncbi:alpha/beta fold hydrolase [Nocardia caishijiensis]|uniref:Pimeloyl-ACP methyl ester carboxylesterase n=1 Tax=Nocardia caishijiensis TaxID=184756 RepID=A0ABQ6YFP2_9NOCA|nr:alpha/beta fold hydrolase [Nocardia caishijiensis]KAF0836576.1 pimeloyl-ACP methyl ester carboxylesterase [Nocardia caishijiensis]